MKLYLRIEHELREAQLKGLQTGLGVAREAAERHGASAATVATIDEIMRLIACLEEQQRGTKLM